MAVHGVYTPTSWHRLRVCLSLEYTFTNVILVGGAQRTGMSWGNGSANMPLASLCTTDSKGSHTAMAKPYWKKKGTNLETPGLTALAQTSLACLQAACHVQEATCSVVHISIYRLYLCRRNFQFFSQENDHNNLPCKDVAHTLQDFIPANIFKAQKLKKYCALHFIILSASENEYFV